MSKSGIDQLVDKWLHEPGFKARLANDPEGTVTSCGITLNAEEWATLRNVVMSSSDQQLLTRISKGGGGIYN